MLTGLFLKNMYRQFVLSIVVLCIFFGWSQYSWAQAKGIVPVPQLMDWEGGTTVVSPDSIVLRTVSPEEFVAVTRLKSVVSSEEAYVVEVMPHKVVITATAAPGLFYGMQSLEQLAEHTAEHLWKLPLGRVDDAPRFPYRGFMMDVSRHFRSKEFVKKQMDAMARYKLNRLHLHLTDAAGWRLEIKRYPRLTEFAAWRPAATWKEWWNEPGGRKYCEWNDPKAQGGYYSQDDIRELVQYAAERQITIIPEIEMSSHSEEVLAAYPSLSCSGEPYRNSDFCVGNEEVFTFLENVLLEVIHLFPSEYVHIGGDEAGKQAWKTCPKCQRRMQAEGLDNVDELQSYLIHRIEVFLNKHGRKLLGWDEIMEGGLAPHATVMSWRGEEGGLKAAKAGHQVVMTPGGFCYLDSYQDAPHTQPEAIGGYLPLSKVYAYNPVPASFSSEQAAMIQGVQGNLWAEFIPTDAHYEYMTYPRLLAIAEVGWSMPEMKSYADFFPRALREVEWLQQRGYHPFPLGNEIGERAETRQPVKHLALGKPVIYQAPYHFKYQAQGDATLTDGQRGGWTYSDGAWQGFISRERLDVTIDLEQEQPIHAVYADFIQVVNPEVFLPEEVIISVSVDGIHFEELKKMNHTVDKTKPVCFQKYGWEGRTLARYVRYQARTVQQVNGWIFTDEIIIN